MVQNKVFLPAVHAQVYRAAWILRLINLNLTIRNETIYNFHVDFNVDCAVDMWEYFGKEYSKFLLEAKNNNFNESENTNSKLIVFFQPVSHIDQSFHNLPTILSKGIFILIFNWIE